MGAPRIEGLNSAFPPDTVAARKNGPLVKEIVDRTFREYKEVAIGNKGKLWQRGAPKAYPDLVFNIDVDDTLLQSSQVKETRKREYKEELLRRKIEISETTVDRVMRVTYTIAQEEVGKGSYVTDNHAKLLAWITDEMAEAPEGQRREAVVNQTLTRLEEEGIRDTDPLRKSDGLLALTYDSASLPALEGMFERTLLETQEFRGTVDATAHLCRLRDQGMNIQVNLLTLGYTHEQQVKIAGLMERNQDVRPDRIFSTRVRKDEFMKEARENDGYKALPLTYPDGQVGTDGNVNPYRHVVLGVDDRIESLTIQRNMASFLADAGAKLALVRLRRETRDGHLDWNDKGDDLEIDLRERKRTMTGVELAEELVKRGELYLYRMGGRIPLRRQGDPVPIRIGIDHAA